MTKPLIMIGAGGHASVLAEVLQAVGRCIIAVVSPEALSRISPLAGIAQLTTDDSLLTHFTAHEVELVNGLGPLPGKHLHCRLFNYFSEKGYRFASVVSPHSIVSKHARLSEGVQIMAGAIIQTNTKIHKNSLINSGAIVEHDCIIGEHNHIAPGAILSGGVITAHNVHIGTGANIIQGVNIGQRAVIGAGATIVRDVPPGQVLIPARSRILSSEKV